LKKVITYGTYDLLHYGHLALLKNAKALGDYLIVGVTSDAFDRSRGKLNVKQSTAERIEAVKATGIADKIIVEEYEGQKIDDIQKYDVDVFTVGSDWVGKFDYLNNYCKVVYLPRTEGISSTKLRTNENPIIQLGIIGVNSPSARFFEESLFVNGIHISGAYDLDLAKAQKFCQNYDLKTYSTLNTLFADCDAVFVNLPINHHQSIIIKSLEAGCHVICDAPAFLSSEDAQKAFEFAAQKNLVLFEGIKTLFFPAFQHLLLLVRSGLIGTIKNIDVSCSQIPNSIETIQQDPYQGSFYDWGATALLPIIKILGTNYKNCNLYNFEQNHFSYLTCGLLEYPSAIGTFKAGKGIKTEGSLIITGEKGYIYVPAPWWKPDYFEVRYEDLRATRKYFYKYEGEGIRYEILEFLKMINTGMLDNYKYPQEEILKIAQIIEQFSSPNTKTIQKG
jgi:glycerol-3-phosphate cytidylyltransferase